MMEEIASDRRKIGVECNPEGFFPPACIKRQNRGIVAEKRSHEITVMIHI